MVKQGEQRSSSNLFAPPTNGLLELDETNEKEEEIEIE